MPVFNAQQPEPACPHPDAGRTWRNSERTGERSLYMSSRYRKVPDVGTIDLDMITYCPRKDCPSPFITIHENARVGGADKHWWLCQRLAAMAGAVPVLELYNPSLRLIKVIWRPDPAQLAETRGWLTECEHHEWLAERKDEHDTMWHQGIVEACGVA